MWTLLIVLVLLAIGVGTIWLLLKSMGASGVEAAAPGSCRSGRCGVDSANKPVNTCASSGCGATPDETTQR